MSDDTTGEKFGKKISGISPGSYEVISREDLDRRNEAARIEWMSRNGVAAGSIVTLKTGGPAMVVMSTTATEAFVAWHNDSGDLYEKLLPFVALKVKP